MTGLGRRSGSAAVLVTALVLLLPPDNYPELRPALLLLVALGAVLGDRSLLASPGAPVLGAFLSVSVVSLAWTPSLELGSHAMLSWLLAGSLFLLATGADLRSLPPVLAAVVLFHGGHAAWQHWVSLPRLTAELAATPGAAPAEFLQRASGARAFSTFVLPGQLAAALAACTPILAAEARGAQLAWRRRLAGLGLVAVALGMYCSRGLGGAVALVLVVGVYLVGRGVRRLRARHLGAGLAALVLLGVIVATRVPDLRDSAAQDNPITTRWRLWQRSAALVASAPVAGIGLGGHGNAWLPYLRPGDVQTPHAHMSYLELAAELGLPAVILLALFFGLALRRPRSPQLALALAVLLLHAAIDFDLQASGLLALTLALAGFAVRYHDGERSLLTAGAPASAAGAGGLGGRVAIALVVLVAALAATAEDRARLPRQRQRQAQTGVERELAARSALRWWPISARQRGELASALADQGRLAEALSECAAARRLEPHTPWLAALEGGIRVARGEPLAAYLAYREASRRHPNSRVYRERAEALAAVLAASAADTGDRVAPLAGDTR